MNRVFKGAHVVASLFFLVVPAMLMAQFKTGAERTDLYYPLLKDRLIGVVANQASVIGQTNVVDVLLDQGFKVARIFSPEHGFRMSGEAGQIIGDAVDTATGIKVVSLYGAHKKPALSDLQSVDLVVFDIQDVGVRFYTYISTLTYVMERCAEAKIPLIVLDRPNPNGFYVDGPVLEKEFASFVGLHPVPVVYGMTIGEYALMVNGEKWIDGGMRCDLRVIPLENYHRMTTFPLPAKPSPNLPSREAVELYPSLCLFEGTCISVGRGTMIPFQVYGHPDLNYGNYTFIPVSIAGLSLHPPLEGKICRGEDLRKFYLENPAESGRLNLQWLMKAYAGFQRKEDFFTDYFNKLAGNSTLKQQIIQGMTENQIRDSWQPGISNFNTIRKKYLLY
jgi:uncharacterized protein YbbC (DUF1343 family)